MDNLERNIIILDLIKQIEVFKSRINLVDYLTNHYFNIFHIINVVCSSPIIVCFG